MGRTYFTSGWLLMLLTAMDMPIGLILRALATLPSAPDFRQTLIVTMIVGVIAFAVCGGLLAGFIRSLSQESDREEAQFTRRSAYWLTALILSLLVFSVAFMWNALGW